MELETFLAKVNRDDSTIQKTERSGGSECGRIVRIVREHGYSLYDLEGYSDYPRFIIDAWQRGYAGIPMGVYDERLPAYYQRCLSYIHSTGREHQSREQQAGVSPEVEPVGQSTGTTPRYHIHWSTGPNGNPVASLGGRVGSTPTNTRSRPEPERIIYNGDYVSVTFDPATGTVVRSPPSPEEGGVSSVRDEREGSERGEEDTEQSFRRSVERSPRGEV